MQPQPSCSIQNRQTFSYSIQNRPPLLTPYKIGRRFLLNTKSAAAFTPPFYRNDFPLQARRFRRRSLLRGIAFRRRRLLRGVAFRRRRLLRGVAFSCHKKPRLRGWLTGRDVIKNVKGYAFSPFAVAIRDFLRVCIAVITACISAACAFSNAAKKADFLSFIAFSI